MNRANDFGRRPGRFGMRRGDNMTSNRCDHVATITGNHLISMTSVVAIPFGPAKPDPPLIRQSPTEVIVLMANVFGPIAPIVTYRRRPTAEDLLPWLHLGGKACDPGRGRPAETTRSTWM